MSMQLVVEDATELADGIFEARLNPADLEAVGAPRAQEGAVSVVLMTGARQRPSGSSVLKFSPRSAILLNLGRSERTLFVSGSRAATPEEAEEDAQKFGPLVQHDDDRFLNELQQLSPSLIKAGQELLARARNEFGGYFQISHSGRYINRPDNFWTVKVQPRDVSLAITVRGEPEGFTPADGIEVKADRSGYSRFKVEREDQLEAAWKLLVEAARD